VFVAFFVTTKHETQQQQKIEQNKEETIVIESLELITASKHAFTLRRFLCLIMVYTVMLSAP
jgi:hypothetical protein